MFIDYLVAAGAAIFAFFCLAMFMAGFIMLLVKTLDLISSAVDRARD